MVGGMAVPRWMLGCVYGSWRCWYGAAAHRAHLMELMTALGSLVAAGLTRRPIGQHLVMLGTRNLLRILVFLCDLYDAVSIIAGVGEFMQTADTPKRCATLAMAMSILMCSRMNA